MESWLPFSTSVVLILAWLALEIAQGRRCARGTVVHALEDREPLAGLLAVDLVVRLDDGREVMARASGCARCQQGSTDPGSRVALLKGKDGFVVMRPWLGCGPARAEGRGR